MLGMTRYSVDDFFTFRRQFDSVFDQSGTSCQVAQQRATRHPSR